MVLVFPGPGGLIISAVHVLITPDLPLDECETSRLHGAQDRFRLWLVDIVRLHGIVNSVGRQAGHTCSSTSQDIRK
jgi:hypothetical protein